MKVFKWFIAGVANGILAHLASGFFCGFVFASGYLENPETWKPMEHLPMGQMFLLNIVAGLIFTYVYMTFYKGIPGEGKISKGINFGVLVWLIEGITGPLMGLVFINMSLVVAISWICGGFAGAVLCGIATAAILGEIA